MGSGEYKTSHLCNYYSFVEIPLWDYLINKTYKKQLKLTIGNNYRVYCWSFYYIVSLHGLSHIDFTLQTFYFHLIQY